MFFPFRLVPSDDLSKAINSYKNVSSRFMKRDFPKIKHDLWKEMFWSQSYCLLTTDGVPIDSIRKYIESQGKK
ncbi:Transposase [Bacillus cereus R309803]|nr:Transposase [Bacillus cereus R309803]